MSQPTLLDILNKTAEYFRQKQIPNPRLDAQLLLGQVLRLKRLDLYMNFDRPLSEAELERLREVVKRRALREPLQYILGEWPFRELLLKVDKRALIPRPETELLVDLARKKLPAAARPVLLDIGVGSGAIFLSLLKEIPSAMVHGVDISKEALDLCRENAEKNGLKADHLFEGDGFQPFQAGQKFDLIVSNPPYVGAKEMEGLEPELRHEPAIALVGGPLGHENPLRLLVEAWNHLEEGGALLLEIGHDQGSLLCQEAAKRGYQDIALAKDYGGSERFLSLRR